jgi:hypothetical protein
MPYTTVEVEIDLDDFTTEDLVEELERRDAYQNALPEEIIEQLAHIHRARLCGQPWEDDLDRFLKDTLGRAI